MSQSFSASTATRSQCGSAKGSFSREAIPTSNEDSINSMRRFLLATFLAR